ncbi:MAG: hypothetical protein KC416_06400 [Myxococcales bacterium]|nr:hypothetical protein [Myxococcales bacterium]
MHGAEQAHPFPGDMPRTAVYATDNTPEAILDGMRAGRIIVTGGPIGDFRLLGGQGSAGIGASFTSTEAPRAAVDITGVDSHLELRILRCGEIIITQTIDADGSYSFDLDAIPGWYRAELWHGKRPRMITNHILWDHAD